MSDALQRAGRGEKPALEGIYQATSAKLFGICLRILHDRQEAEDVLQEVYVSVWRRAASFDPARASPITWLATLARNRSIDRLRSGAKARRMRPIDDAVAISDPAPGALAQVVSSEEHRRLMGCLDELEPRHAAAIRAAFLDGATYEDLAQRVNVPLGTMKSWIRRSLMRLRDCLER